MVNIAGEDQKQRLGGLIPEHQLLPDGVFPDFELTEALVACGNTVLFRACYIPDGSCWITLIVNPKAFLDEAHRNAFIERMTELAEVEHESLLSIVGVDVSGEWIAVVYEDFAGSPLHGRLDERLAPANAVKIVGEASDAVHAAHQAGFVHRDIHPGWILVDDQEAGNVQVKLAAVGIVPALFASDLQFIQTMADRPSPLRCYLAPEQLVPADPSDFRADIYALGAITYRLLVGRPPGGFAILPSSRADVNRGTDDIVHCAMHTDREKRYESAAAFSEQVRKVGTGNNNDPLAGLRYVRKQQDQEITTSRGPSRLVPVILLVLLLGTLSVGGVIGVKFLMTREKDLAASSPSDGSGPAKAIGAEQSKELKQVRVLMDKGDKEAAIAIAAALVRSSVKVGEKAMNPAALEAAVLMSVEGGDAGGALELSAMRAPKGTKAEDAVEWQRVEALTKQLEVGTQGYQRAMQRAEEARKAGNHSQERMELATASGFLPEHPDAKNRTNLARQDNDYNPGQELANRLAKVEMSNGSAPGFSIHERDAEMHVDLSNNPHLTDLSMLTGMPITHLNASNTAVSDLAPLRGMPLQELYVDNTKVKDISPLEGAPLRLLSARGVAPSGLERILHTPMLESLSTGMDPLSTNKILPPKPGRGWLNRSGLRFDPMLTGGTILCSHWEMRRSDFREFVEATSTHPPDGMTTLMSDGSWGKIENFSSDKPPFEQTEDHPVIGISHREAVAFCKWMTRRDRESGEIGPQAFYRLPTSAEWSLAAGTSRKPYSWGTDWPPTELTENLPPQMELLTGNELGNYQDGYPATGPVGSFRGTRIADLGGNVREWCQDEIAGSDAQTLHVVRGAAWGLEVPDSESYSESYKTVMRLGREDLLPADAQWSNLGFRVVIDLGLGY